MKKVDLVGQRFGRLLVVKHAGANRHRQSLFRCVCDCGAEVVTLGPSLTSGRTSSCGCVQRERAALRLARHNHSRARAGRRPSPTYKTWRSMVERCTDQKAVGFRLYGGRGITVCARWLGEHGFENFLADMGERPAGKTLDRFPNRDGDYEPGNCRWATAKEQARNTRRNRILTIDGESAPAVVWEERMGLPKGLVADRIYRGWSPRAAVLTPVVRGRPRSRPPMRVRATEGQAR